MGIDKEKLEELMKLKEQIKERQEKIVNQINRNKATIDLYEKQLEELKQECAALGVDPDNIEQHIEKLYSELKDIADNYIKSLKEVYVFLKDRGLWNE